MDFCGAALVWQLNVPRGNSNDDYRISLSRIHQERRNTVFPRENQVDLENSSVYQYTLNEENRGWGKLENFFRVDKVEIVSFVFEDLFRGEEACNFCHSIFNAVRSVDDV